MCVYTVFNWRKLMYHAEEISNIVTGHSFSFCKPNQLTNISDWTYFVTFWTVTTYCFTEIKICMSPQNQKQTKMQYTKHDERRAPEYESYFEIFILSSRWTLKIINLIGKKAVLHTHKHLRLHFVNVQLRQLISINTKCKTGLL